MFGLFNKSAFELADKRVCGYLDDAYDIYIRSQDRYNVLSDDYEGTDMIGVEEMKAIIEIAKLLRDQYTWEISGDEK